MVQERKVAPPSCPKRIKMYYLKNVCVFEWKFISTINYTVIVILRIIAIKRGNRSVVLVHSDAVLHLQSGTKLCKEDTAFLI